MDTLEFLKTILPEEGVKYLAVITADGRVAHKAYTSLEAMAEGVHQWDAKPVQVYHACGSYQNEFVEIDGKKKYRVSENWARAKSFWIDIDCGEDKAEKGTGYVTKRAAYIELKEFCGQTGLPMPLVVDSGNGLHCYWVLEKSIPAATWVKLATVLKAVFNHFEFLADPTATADFARILRPVGSNNKKREPKAVVTKTSAVPIDPRQFAEILSSIKVTNEIEIVERKPLAELNDDLTAHLAPPPNLPAYAELVADKCAQVAAMRDTQGDVGYEHWRGVIGIIKHCEEGIDLAHKWSERREETGHSQNDVDTKFNTWSSPPTTCEFFSKCNPSGCASCPHKGNIKTPIVLGRKEPEPEKSEVEATVEGKAMLVELPEFPPGFGRNGTSMVAYEKDKNDITHAFTFCHNLFYPTHRICKENGEFSIGIRMHLPDNRTRDFELDTQVLPSNQKTVEGLAKYELVPTNYKGSAMYMTAYLRESLQKLMREAEELNTYTSFGWQKDYQSFLIGDRLYHKDGTIRKVLVGGYADDRLIEFPTPTGNIQVYADALNFLYARPGMEHMQYVVASTFGSILTPFCDTLYKGICFAVISSQPGKGKTTACFTGLYGFGNADKIAIKSEQATINALYAHIGVHNQIPVLYDEVTNIDPEDLSKLCYAITSGQERQRLTAGKGTGVRFANSQTWEMILFLTANTNLHSLLASRQSNTEAEAVRLIQVDVDRYPMPDIGGEVDVVMKRLAMNQGVAGEAFVQYVVQNLDDVLKQLGTWGARIKADIPDVKYRFYRSQAMTAMVALEICNQLGITNFEIEPVYEFVKKLFFELADNVKEQNTVTAEDAFNRMLNDLSPRVLVTTEYRDGRDSRGPEDGNRIANGAVAGRYIMGNTSTKANPITGKLYLVKKEITDWCLKHRVDYKTMMTSVTASGVAVDMREKFNVGRGTKVSAGQHRCVEIDMLKLEAQGVGTPKLTVHTGGKVEGSEVANT
jgi:hypothetical protein